MGLIQKYFTFDPKYSVVKSTDIGFEMYLSKSNKYSS